MSHSSRSKSSGKKISAASVVEIILIAVLVLVMLFMLSSAFLFKKDGNNSSVASIFGYSFYNTKAVNMQNKIPPNTLVIAKKLGSESIEPGCVVLCKLGDSTVLIRVHEILQEDGKTYYILKFDTDDTKYRVSADAIIARAVWQINGIGKFLDFATSTVGIIIAVVIPLIFIIAIQVAKILSIKRLEEEASSLDDIDGFMQSRDEEEPAPVTFTEPKFVEDVTGKLPHVGEERETVPKIEKVLSFDSRGRAEYIERPAEPKEQKAESPLYTYDRLGRKNAVQAISAPEVKEPVHSGARTAEAYINRPTKIEAENSSTDDLFEKYAMSGKSEPVVFTPRLSVIPDSIAAVQEETAAVRKQAPEAADKTYYEKPEPVMPAGGLLSGFDPKGEKAAIPEKAVLPKETIAPPKKQKSSKALAELMSIIDAEETKLKK